MDIIRKKTEKTDVGWKKSSKNAEYVEKERKQSIIDERVPRVEVWRKKNLLNGDIRQGKETVKEINENKVLDGLFYVNKYVLFLFIMLLFFVLNIIPMWIWGPAGQQINWIYKQILPK